MNFFVTAVLWLLVSPTQTESTSSHAQAAHSVVAEMRNVNYHFTDTIAVQISQLVGKLVPKREIPVFDDKQSFVLEIDSAMISYE